MSYPERIIKQAESKLSAVVGVPVHRTDDGQWLMGTAGKARPAGEENAAAFEAVLEELSRERPDAAKRQRPPQSAVRGVAADVANAKVQRQAIADSPARSGVATRAAFRFADDPTGASLLSPFRLAPDAPYRAPQPDDAPIRLPRAAAFRFADDLPPTSAPASTPASTPPVTAPTPQQQLSLAQMRAQQRGLQAASQFAQAPVRQATGGAWQVNFAGQWHSLGADDATSVQRAYQSGMRPNAMQWATGAMGQAGRTMWNQAAQYVGPMLPTLGVLGAAYNVHGAGRAAENGTRALMDGAASLGASAFDTGAKIADTLLSAVLRPFGPSGEAALEMGRALNGTVRSALKGVSDTATHIVGTGARLVGTVATAGLGVGGAMLGAAIAAPLGAGIGAVTGGIGGAAGGGAGMAAGAATGAVTGAAGAILPGAMLGALVGTAAGLIASKLVSAVAEGVGGLLGGIGKIFGAIGDLATAAFRSTFAVLKDLSDVAQHFGRDVAIIRAQTGLSTAQSGTFALSFGAVGLRGAAPTLAGNRENQPFAFGMRNSLFGLPSYASAEFLPMAAQRFQQMQRGGPLGQMMALNMAESAGLNSPEALRVLQMAPERLRSNIGFSAGLNADLGLNPEKIRALSDSLYLLQARADSTVEAIKMRLAQEALPYVEKAFAWIADHSKEISGFIKAGVSWLIQDMPPMLMRAGATGLEAVSRFAGGVGDFAVGLIEKVPGFLTGVDAVLNALRKLALFAVGVGAAIAQGVDNLSGGKLSALLNRDDKATSAATADTAVPSGAAATGGASIVNATNNTAGNTTPALSRGTSTLPAKDDSGFINRPGGYRTPLGMAFDFFHSTAGRVGGYVTEQLGLPRQLQGNAMPLVRGIYDTLRPAVDYGVGGAAIGTVARYFGPSLMRGASSLVTGGVPILANIASQAAGSALRPVTNIAAPLLGNIAARVAPMAFPGGAMAPGLGVALATPLAGAGVGAIGAVTAAGLLAAGTVSYGAYKGAQALGLANKDQSFSDAIQTGAGRLWARVTTGDAANYDRFVANSQSPNSATNEGVAASPNSSNAGIMPVPMRPAGAAFNDAIRQADAATPKANFSSDDVVRKLATALAAINEHARTAEEKSANGAQWLRSSAETYAAQFANEGKSSADKNEAPSKRDDLVALMREQVEILRQLQANRAVLATWGEMSRSMIQDEALAITMGQAPSAY